MISLLGRALSLSSTLFLALLCGTCSNATPQSGDPIFNVPVFPEPPPPSEFNGASYPFPVLPDAAQIFSGQRACRQTYTTCMDVFRDCLRVVGPIGNGANMLCEAWRNEVCEEGIREGCDRLPPDNQTPLSPETFTFSFTTSSVGTISGSPVQTASLKPSPSFSSLPTPTSFVATGTISTGIFTTTITAMIPITDDLGATTGWDSESFTMTMSRDRRGLVFMADSSGGEKPAGSVVLAVAPMVAVALFHLVAVY